DRYPAVRHLPPALPRPRNAPRTFKGGHRFSGRQEHRKAPSQVGGAKQPRRGVLMPSRTMAVHLRIVKPLDRKWEDVGPRLRDLAWLAHRVLNRTMTALALAAEHPGSAPA